MEADFQRYYRLDLRELVVRMEAGEAGYTIRRLWALVVGLPAEAAYLRTPAKPRRRKATPEEIARMMGEFN